jgi:alpha-ribazole phosphatase CobZ
LVTDVKPETLPLLKYLEEKGITLKDLIDTALEMFVPHPGVETREEATEILEEEFLDALSDVNVSCLEVACFRAEDDAGAGLVPGLTKERFMGRPGLVADELLGMTIASYIAGARGIFEFIRFDQTKPGILKKLGPISNDAIGGLIAGVSSNMYSNALRRSQDIPINPGRKGDNLESIGRENGYPQG